MIVTPTKLTFPTGAVPKALAETGAHEYGKIEKAVREEMEPLFTFSKAEFDTLIKDYGVEATTATMIQEINRTLPEGSQPLIYEELKEGSSPYLITSEDDLKKPQAYLRMSDEDMLVNFSNVRGGTELSAMLYGAKRATPEMLGAGIGASAAMPLAGVVNPPHPIANLVLKALTIGAGSIAGAMAASKIEDELFDEQDPTVPSLEAAARFGETATYFATPSVALSGPLRKGSDIAGRSLKAGLTKVSESELAKNTRIRAAKIFNRKSNPDAIKVNKAQTSAQVLKDFDIASKIPPEKLDDYVTALYGSGSYSDNLRKMVKKSIEKGSGKAPKRYRAGAFVEKAASDYAREGLERPLYLLGKEAVYGFGSGVGAYSAQELSPYNPIGRFIGEVGGGAVLGSIGKRVKDAGTDFINSKIAAVAADGYSGQASIQDLTGAFMKKSMAKGVNKLDQRGVKRFIDSIRKRPEFEPVVDEQGNVVKTTNELIGEFFDEMSIQAKVRSANEVERLKKEIDIDRRRLKTESLDSTTLKEIQKSILEKENKIEGGIKTNLDEIEWENEDWSAMAKGYTSVFKGFEKYLKTKTQEGRAIAANTLLEPIYLLQSQGDPESLQSAATLMRQYYKDNLENTITGAIDDLITKQKRVTGGALSKSASETSEKLYIRLSEIAEAADKNENKLWDNVDNYAILNFNKDVVEDFTPNGLINKDVVEDFTPISGNNRLAAMVAGEPDPQALPNIVKVLKGKEFSDADTREGLGGMSQQLQEMVEFFTLSNKDEAVIRQYRKDVESYRKLLAKKENPPKGETFTKADQKALVGLRNSKGYGKLDSAESKMAEMVLRLDQANSVRSVLSNTNSADQALSVIGTDSQASKYMSVKDARKEYPLMADKLVRLRSQLLTKARNLRAGAAVPKNAALAGIADSVTSAILKDLDLGKPGERAAYDLARSFTNAKSDVFTRTFLNKVKSKARTGQLTMNANDLVNSVFRGPQSAQINNIEAIESAAEFLVKEGAIKLEDFPKYTTTDLVLEAFRSRFKKFINEYNTKIKSLGREEDVIKVREAVWKNWKNENSDLLDKFSDSSIVSDMDNLVTSYKLFKSIDDDPINAPIIKPEMIDKALLGSQPEIAEVLLGRLGLQEIQKGNPTKAIIQALNGKKPVVAIKSLLGEIDKATSNGKKLKITSKNEITGETIPLEVGNKDLRKAFTSSILQAGMEASQTPNGVDIAKLIGFLKQNMPGLNKTTDYSLLDLMIDQKLITPSHKESIEQALKAFNEADTAYKTQDYSDVLFDEPSAAKMLGIRLAGATMGTVAQNKLKQTISKIFGFNFGMSGGFIAEQAGSQFLRDLLVDSPTTVGNRRLAMLFSDAEALSAFGKALKDGKPEQNLGIIDKFKKYITYIPPFGSVEQIPRAGAVPTVRTIEREIDERSNIKIQPNTTSSVNSPRASNIQPNPVRQVATGQVTSPTTNPTAVGIQGTITPESAQRFAQVFGANDSVLTMGIGGLVR